MPFFDKFQQFMTPERSIQMAGVGQALSQIGAGQQVDLSSSLQALQKRQADAQAKAQIGELSQRFTPDQQAVLAAMPPELAMQVISQDSFKAPSAPTKGVNVGGQLINPVTGEVMYAGQQQPVERNQVKGADGFLYYTDTGERVLPDVSLPQADVSRTVTGDEAAEMGLDPSKAYNVTEGPQGRKVSAIGGGGVNVNLGDASQFGAAPSGTAWVFDGAGNHVMEQGPNGVARPQTVALGGSEAEKRVIGVEADKEKDAASRAQASNSVDLIDDIINDPYLGSITGMIQGNFPPLTQGGTDLNVKLDQLKGQAFLQAFQSLKGGGSITEPEGRKAEQAIARLNRAQSRDAYIEALGDLRSILDNGIRRSNGETVPEYSGQPSRSPDIEAAIMLGLE